MTAKYMISTGRGGAGNMHYSDSKATPKIVKKGSQTPNIIQPVYSTGRGGAGNMRRNIDPVLTRKAQDVDDSEGDDEDAVSDEDYINIDDVIANSHDSDLIDESVTPIQVLKGNTVNAQVTNVRSHSATAHPSNKQKSRRNSMKNVLSNDKPKTIAIGRGGAGNMLSASSSAKSVDGYVSNTSVDRKKKNKKKKNNNEKEKKSQCIIC